MTTLLSSARIFAQLNNCSVLYLCVSQGLKFSFDTGVGILLDQYDDGILGHMPIIDSSTIFPESSICPVCLILKSYHS